MGTSRRSQLLIVESTLFCLQRCNIKIHVHVCQNTTLILCYSCTHICTSIEDMWNCQALSLIWNVCSLKKALKKDLTRLATVSTAHLFRAARTWALPWLPASIFLACVLFAVQVSATGRDGDWEERSLLVQWLISQEGCVVAVSQCLEIQQEKGGSDWRCACRRRWPRRWRRSGTVVVSALICQRQSLWCSAVSASIRLHQMVCVGILANDHQI